MSDTILASAEFFLHWQSTDARYTDHEYFPAVERMGLVLEYFRQTRQFAGMATESWRGWPRPEGDKYYPQRRTADPVFAVSGQRR
jgi:hypothetical protein